MMDKVTVQQAKRYADIMQDSDTGNAEKMARAAALLLPAVFGTIRPAEVLAADVCEVLAAMKCLHFVMQSIVLPCFQLLQDEPEVEQEASAFDEYDEENGYNEAEPQDGPWTVCSNNVDTVVMMAIRLLRQSYTETMQTELVPLVKHLRFEIDHAPKG